MCAHLAISAASEATGAMSGVCAVAVGALAGLIGLKVSFAAPPRAPKKRQPRNGVTERERPRCFCEPLGAEPMSIRSRLPRASVAKGPPGISFHSSEAADHLNCTRVSTGHWCGTGLKKAHLTVRVSLARLFVPIRSSREGQARLLNVPPARLPVDLALLQAVQTQTELPFDRLFAEALEA